jgi:hypothetical protein
MKIFLKISISNHILLIKINEFLQTNIFPNSTLFDPISVTTNSLACAAQNATIQAKGRFSQERECKLDKPRKTVSVPSLFGIHCGGNVRLVLAASCRLGNFGNVFWLKAT